MEYFWCAKFEAKPHLSALFEAKYFSYGIVDAIRIKIAPAIEEEVSVNMFIQFSRLIVSIREGKGVPNPKN